MSFIGGYKMIDLRNQSLSTTKVTINGIYESIKNSYKKPLMLININIGGVEKNNTFVTLKLSGTTFSCDVYGYTIQITNKNEVTATAITGGGV